MDLIMNDTPSPTFGLPKLLTAREAAQTLRISLSTLYRMEQTGQLTPLRTPGGHRRYTLDMLMECLAAPPKTEPAPQPEENSHA
jgi:excisionase family DNA binding protein